MPSIKVKSSTGKTEFRYNIATPTSASAKSIDKSLPTVLMLHPVYVSSEIYHLQHLDPRLRKFNLVTVDYRMHGETTGDKIPPSYRQAEAAEDIVKLMDALKLPPCHIVGLSLGTIIGLQIAVSYPGKVRSLFLMSPLGLEEPQDVAEGRTEIFDYWCQGFSDSGVDEATLMDALYGALQLGVSNRTSTLISAYSTRLFGPAQKLWSPKNFPQFRAATLDIFIERQSHSLEALSTLRNIPIALIHGLDDVAYPLTYTEEFMQQLKDAGVSPKLYKVPGQPHFLNVDTKEPEVNGIMHDFLVENSQEKLGLLPTEPVSPWTGVLKKHGWDPEEDAEEPHVI
ncbi:alpha/beta-hydrolase [Dendrothele bispora CBS 962.96]|uniref:Alpha/beta-hydrolase n=1 Tax=Dendrothele bispora (strain CBS 962.96) TaxID=1314807 RepID=A0A4S8KS15_DENBC|nr:alpha/beta-hydrolase [Dendrothele bispora CBS 962.96]